MWVLQEKVTGRCLIVFSVAKQIITSQKVAEEINEAIGRFLRTTCNTLDHEGCRE